METSHFLWTDENGNNVTLFVNGNYVKLVTLAQMQKAQLGTTVTCYAPRFPQY